MVQVDSAEPVRPARWKAGVLRAVILVPLGLVFALIADFYVRRDDDI